MLRTVDGQRMPNMNRPHDSMSAVSLRSVEGGRAALERDLLRAVLLDLPSLTELMRRLTTAANTQLKVVPPCCGGPDGTGLVSRQTRDENAASNKAGATDTARRPPSGRQR